jgi:hypothetical protein
MVATVVLIFHQGLSAIVHLDWAYEGERKDVIITFKDGTRCVVDMLADSPGFKSSLWHEYEGVIDDFCSRIELCKMRYDERVPIEATLTSNAINLDLHGNEAVDIVRLVCNTYAKENEQEVKHVEIA